MECSKSLQELAELTGAELRGTNAGEIVISSVGPLDTADGSTLSFLSNKRYRKQLETTKAGAVILSKHVPYDRPCLVSKNPYLDFVKILSLFAPTIPLPETGIHSMAFVHPEAKVADDVAIGPFCVVQAGAQIGKGSKLVAQVYVGENTTVGEECQFYPGVVIRESISIGNRVILHPGVVLGGDGFGFAPEGGKYRKIPQIGTVVVEDDVEIGANTTVDRAALGETRIGQGTKLDNLVMVAHNVRIGSNTVIAGQTGFSGSTKVGNNVMMGGQIGTEGHIEIGDRVIVAGQSGITKDVASDQFISGYPAKSHKEDMRLLAEFHRLPKLRKKIECLEARLKELTKE
jgi:UDP-3-O-[3-hydroxymyristoyl] glucosamine N-acyltransferase